MAMASCRDSKTDHPAQGHRFLVLAFDGLDPKITRKLMNDGKMPNLAKLVRNGSFSKLATSTPPHTPVAFSNIISGSDASVHQIFDFIHRHPRSKNGPFKPYFSTADIVAPEYSWLPSALPLGGKWQVPLTGGSTVLLRQGPSFWDSLIRNGVDTQVYYLPSNYPPPKPEGPGNFRCISGMGTPDILGGYGEFTLLTPDAPKAGRQVDGGRFVRLRMRKHRGSALLQGPPDFMQKSAIDAATMADPLETLVEVVRDPKSDVARIRISGQTLIMNAGEWSHWTAIGFTSKIPGSSVMSAAGAPSSVQGIVRFFLKSVHPKLEIYVSPFNIDPVTPISDISTPSALSSQIAKKFGRFHTNGIPEDTKALSHRALNEDQFIDQSHAVVAERVQQYQGALANFDSGCLFFYFGATDLLQHMFWRDRDPEHPGRVDEQAEKFGSLIDETYVEIDKQIGAGLDRLKATDTMIVFSDHGFTSFRRGFNLNSWLVKEGFIKLKNLAAQTTSVLYSNVDWGKTKAYGLGLNGLYINEKGREQFGCVGMDEKQAVMAEILDKLRTVRDTDGNEVVTQVDQTQKLFSNVDPDIAPDLIIGYGDGYRASWETVLGGMPRDLLVDNKDRWSGTHLTDPNIVPGMFASNRTLSTDLPTISDLAPTILAEFGISPPTEMSGKSLFAESKYLQKES